MSNHGGCLLDVKALIANHGTVDITAFDAQAHSSAGGTVEDHWQGAFPETQQLAYSLSVQFVIDDCQDVIICLDVSNPNGEQDQSPADNHLCATLSNEFVIIGPYSNPAGDFIRLDILLPSKGSLKITNYDVIGQTLGEVQYADAEKGYYPITMDTRHLVAGVYILKIEYHDEERVLKYIVR